MGFKIERLQQVIRRKVSQTIHREINDPRMGLITITYVKLAKDLANCTIGYSMLGGDGDRSKSAYALKSACGFIQREVASVMHTRRSPQLTFEYDESIERQMRISEILKKELAGSASKEELPEDSEDVEEPEDNDISS